MRHLSDVFYLLTGLALSPLVLYRALRHGRYRKGWGHRFGHISRPSPQDPCIWLHAVSVGETNAAQGIIGQLQQRYPRHDVVVSTTTDTGYARAKQLFSDTCTVIYFPLDISWVMSRAFRQLNPCLCLLMELEVWPNFMHTAQQQQVPVVVVNGRISDNSYKSYKRFRALLRNAFDRLTLALVQTAEYAERFQDIGCHPDRVVVTGSIKYDTAEIVDSIEGAAEIAQQLCLAEDQPIWVAGGTGDGEEPLILEAYRDLLNLDAGTNLRLIVVPRKPERFDTVAQMIEQAGFTVQRYSPIKTGQVQATPDPKAVILGDTMGDLRKFYSLASVSFVGRSLVPMGGSDMMEVAALGKPTLFGPFTQNFRQTVRALLAGHGAIEVADKDELRLAVLRCLQDVGYAQQLGRNGQQVIRENQGATEKTLTHLAKILPTENNG
ncbi:3-deoxy-D-manno-octulosonic acid transferase [Planctomycetota bacterium]